MSANLTITAADDIDADGTGSATTGSGGGGGSFPQSSILDSFDRANEGPPPSSNWTDIIYQGADGGLKVVSNVVVFGTGGASMSSYWNTSFGPNYESYATIADIGSGSGVFELWTSLSGLASSATLNGYAIYFSVSASTITINRVDSGSLTALGGTISQTFSNGDSIGMSKVGSTITIYYKASGGSWVSVGTRTDSTYGTGKIGLRLESDSAEKADNFGGGTI